MTAHKCHAFNKDGAPCNAYALSNSTYCYHHDPALAAQRHQARRRGGLARHGRHLGPMNVEIPPLPLQDMHDVAALLREAINDARQLENSLHRARTIGYLSGLLIKALDIALLEERIGRLEHALQWRKETQ